MTKKIPDKKAKIGRRLDGTFLPGTVPNPNGRPKRKTITELIHERLDDPKSELTWQELITIFLSMAKRKDKEILKELWHQTDGLPKQRTEVTGKDGEPLVIIKSNASEIT